MENNLYKKLRFFALCLAIICMILSLIKRAKAQVPDYVKEYSLQFYNNYTFTTEQQAIIDSIYENYNYLYIVEGSGRYHALDNYFIFSKSKIIGFGCNTDTNSTSTSVGTIYYSTSDGYGGFVFDGIQSNNNMDLCIINFYDNNSIYVTENYSNGNYYSMGNNQYKYPGYYARSYSNLFSYYGTRTYLPYSNPDFTYTFHYQEDGNFYRCQRSTSTSYTFFRGFDTFNNTELIVDNTPHYNTDGFKVFKTTRSGRDYLIFDGLNAVPINIRNGNWYLTDLISTLGFTVTTETESYNFNYSFDIDDASEDFPYNSDYFKWQDNWGNLYLRWEIPIDELNLPDDSYGYTENVIMTVSNNVSINNTSVPYLGQFIYLTPIYLYGTQAESGLINPENAPAPVIPENPITQEDKVKNYYSLVYGTLLNKSTSEYESWLNELHDGVLYNQIVFTQLNAPTLQDLFSQFPDMISILNDVISYAYGIQGKNDFLDAMETYIEENAFSQYVDYLVFVYNGNDAEHSDKFDFYIFETAKGRQKAISFLLDTNNTYFDKQFDVLRNSIPYIKDSIDRIDTNLFNLGEDIFSQNNSIIANLISIDNKFNDLQDLLKDLFNKLFDKLNNLHLSQLDAIDNKLSTIVSAIQTETTFNEDDTIAESIAYYQTHTQTQAVLEDKYSVWFTGYCHFWLQEYGEEEPVNNTRSASGNATDFASSEKRHILFRTFKVITDIYNKMQEDLLFNRVEELFDYMLDTNSDVSHTRRSYFYDVFNEQNTPTLDYNPYE